MHLLVYMEGTVQHMMYGFGYDPNFPCIMHYKCYISIVEKMLEKEEEKMLEKIGLAPKPSLRGKNWIVDASHCQGCSSQFTFINRKDLQFSGFLSFFEDWKKAEGERCRLCIRKAFII